MARKSARVPTANPGELEFVQIRKPSDGSWRRAVRSHAARRHYAEARQRFAQQHSEPQVEDTGRRKEPYSGARQCSVNPSADFIDFQVRPEPENSDGWSEWDEPRGIQDPQMPLQIRSIDPFDSLSRPTTRFERHLLDHYIQFVAANADPCPSMACREHVENEFGIHSIRTAVGDKGLLNAILLSACRSLAVLQASSLYAGHALEYKGACIRSVNDAISQREQWVPSVTLATVIALGKDSCLAKDMVAARQHCKAAEMIVQMNGGPRAIQVGHVVKTLVKWVSFETELQKEGDFRKDVWRVLEGYLDEI